MVEELNAIYVLKQPVHGHDGLPYRQVYRLDITPFLDQLPQHACFRSVFICHGIPELMMQCLAYNIQVAVFTENRGDKEPMVSCPHTAIAPMVPHKRSLFKFRYIGWRPLEGGRPIEIRLCCMFYIRGAHPLPCLYVLNHPADQDAIHP